MYDNLEGWDVQESSTAGMLVSLREAIANEEPIIIPGWQPHWMYEEFDLKNLEDPELAFGEKEDINTIVRLGLEEDMPGAYKILDAFEWEVEDMQSIMYEAQDSSFEDAAANWIEANQETVNGWTDGAEKGNGEAISLVSTPWDSERSSSEVIDQVLTDYGFDVTISTVDPAIVFESVANGKADGSLAPWLPSTHGAFLEKNKDDLIDLGPNLSGTQNALAVPAYMEIDSIEDLNAK